MDIDGNEIKRDITHIEWDLKLLLKGGYEYFMEKKRFWTARSPCENIKQQSWWKL